MASSKNFPADMCLRMRDTYMKLSTIARWKNVAIEFMNQEYELQSGSVPDITHKYLIVLSVTEKLENLQILLWG
jgi:hypothetical protein